MTKNFFKKSLGEMFIEQNEEYLDFKKDQKESVLDKKVINKGRTALQRFLQMLDTNDRFCYCCHLQMKGY